MMPTVVRRGRPVSWLAPLVLLVVAAVAAGPAAAHQYSASISAAPSAPEDDASPDAAVEVWAGSSPAVSVTLTNLTLPVMGSADVPLPAGVDPAGPVSVTSTQPGFAGTAALDGSVIELRDLGVTKLKSVTVTLAVNPTCDPTASSYVLSTKAKLTPDFGGVPADDMTLIGPQPAIDIAGKCTLAFSADPADASRDTSITSEIFLPLPSGAPITVTVLDGSGSAPVTWWSSPVDIALQDNPGGGTLTGYVSTTPVGGVASFWDVGGPAPGPLLDVSASNYRLRATSPGISTPPPVSQPFDIVDSGKRCDPGQTCSATTTATKSAVTVSGGATSPDDLLRVSLGSATAAPFVCAGYTPTSEVLDFDLTSLTGGEAGGVKTAVFTLFKQYVTRPANKYEVCYQAPLKFRTKSGAWATPVDENGDLVTDYHTGLLPTCDCTPRSGPRRKDPTPPCILSRKKDRSKNVVVTILAPAGDPRGRI